MIWLIVYLATYSVESSSAHIISITFHHDLTYHLESLGSLRFSCTKMSYVLISLPVAHTPSVPSLQILFSCNASDRNQALSRDSVWPALTMMLEEGPEDNTRVLWNPVRGLAMLIAVNRVEHEGINSLIILSQRKCKDS